MGDGAGKPGGIGSAFNVILPERGDMPSRGLAETEWNVRSVGFIAKPEQTQQLAGCIETSVNDLLRGVTGFLGAIVLRSKHEERNLVVLTFWKTEKQATTNCWEEFQAVRKMLSPMIDVCTKVQTFRATAPPIAANPGEHERAGIC